MPFIGSLEGGYGYGRGPNAADNTMKVQWSTYLPTVPSGFLEGESYGITDNSGNTYITGACNPVNTLTQINIKNVGGFSQVASSFNLPGAASGTSHIYLIKFDSNGQVQWATYFTINSQKIPGKLACDSNNNIYMVGTYQNTGGNTIINLRNASGTTTITSPVTLPTNSGGVSSYLIKYNSEGIVQWATYLGVVNQQHIMTDVCIYSNNLYVIGRKNSASQITTTNMFSANGNTTAPFQISSSITLPSTGSQIWGFLLKYNLNGIAQWATVIPNAFGQLFSVKYNNLGFLLVSGQYSSTTEITLRNASGDGQVNSSWKLEPSGTTTSFNSVCVIKYNDLGIVSWATTLTTNVAFSNTGYSLDIDTENNIYITGRYRQNTSAISLKNANPTNFNQTPSTITLSTTSTNGNMFLMKYNDNGIAQWALNLGDSNTTAIGYSVVINKLTNFIYIVGTYTTTTTITLNNYIENSQTSSTIGLPISTGRGIIMKYTLNGVAKCATFISNQSIIPYDISIFNNVLYIAINCQNFSSGSKPLFNASGNGQNSTSYFLSSFSPTTTKCYGIVKYTG